MNELPAEIPKIDWEYYKANVKSDLIPIVEKLKSDYELFKIPYPVDTLLSEQLALQKESVLVFFQIIQNIFHIFFLIIFLF